MFPEVNFLEFETAIWVGMSSILSVISAGMSLAPAALYSKFLNGYSLRTTSVASRPR